MSVVTLHDPTSVKQIKRNTWYGYCDQCFSHSMKICKVDTVQEQIYYD